MAEPSEAGKRLMFYAMLGTLHTEAQAAPDCALCGDTGYAENSYAPCPACTPTEGIQREA